ncbi:MAG: DUF5615 family PIN-like protein [Cyclobacteriaceae bacterium]|nr:DUF5615 family PIN-like protein [Cyclobacteriaceae bacterium]
MKFLLNENISPSLKGKLSTVQIVSAHVKDIGLIGQPDVQIIEYARSNDYIIITHDLDYSRIISLSAKEKPSVITVRADKISSEILFTIIRQNIANLQSYLEKGALVTIEEDKIRFRLLPIERG